MTSALPSRDGAERSPRQGSEAAQSGFSLRLSRAGKRREPRSGHELQRPALTSGPAHPLLRFRRRPHRGNEPVSIADSQQAVDGMAADDRPAGVGSRALDVTGEQARAAAAPDETGSG